VSQIFLEGITNKKTGKQKDIEIRVAALIDQFALSRRKYEERSRRSQQNNETNSKARWHEKLHGLVQNAVKTLLFHTLVFTVQMTDTHRMLDKQNNSIIQE